MAFSSAGDKVRGLEAWLHEPFFRNDVLRFIQKGCSTCGGTAPEKGMAGQCPGLLGQHLLNGGDDVIHVHAEFLQHLGAGSGEAEAVDAHGFTLGA